MRFADYNREDRRSLTKVVKKNISKKIADSKSPFSFSAREMMEECCEIEITPDGRWYATFDGNRAELLADYFGRGCKGKRMRPWASKKEQSRILAASYRRLADAADDASAKEWDKRAKNTGSCGHHLEFEVLGDGRLRLIQAYFCHDPLCPICNWRKSLKNTAILSEAMSRIVGDRDVRLLHLTLTVQNCRMDELHESIEGMHHAFSKLTKTKGWMKRVLGYARKTEWTVSKNPAMIKCGRIMHPHMHVLLVVPSAYFDTVPDWQNKLADMFRPDSIKVQTSALKCSDYGSAVCAVRGLIAQSILDDAESDGVDVEHERMERTKYRKRYHRMVAHLTEIADAHRPAQSTPSAVRKAIRAFLTAVDEAADPLYINEPDQHMMLNMWRQVMGDDQITDVALQSVKPCEGVIVCAGTTPEKAAMKAAVKEIAKYVGKDGDYIMPHDPDEMDRRTVILREQLAGIRMISYGGLVKEYVAQVKKDWAVEDDDLINLGDKSREESLGEGQSRDKLIVSATWNRTLHAYVVHRYVEVACDGLTGPRIVYLYSDSLKSSAGCTLRL